VTVGVEIRDAGRPVDAIHGELGVHGVAAGTATITAKLESPNLTAPIMVTP
jgi:hypothetical protein